MSYGLQRNKYLKLNFPHGRMFKSKGLTKMEECGFIRYRTYMKKFYTEIGLKN